MNKHYHPLTLEQRYPIGSLRDSGKGLRGIAERVGVNHSTVSRELKRNSGMNGYSPTVADQLCQTRKRSAHKARKRTAGMDEMMIEKLRQGWSPGSISERMKLEKKSAVERLSHVSIYRMIAEDKAQQGFLHLYLPNTGKTRWKGGKRKRDAGASLIPDRVDITKRPAMVEKRQRLGDWEGDTVHGQSAH